VVLATGGGAVMREANRRALHAGGRVVYLHASVEQQVGRTARDRNRPLLRTADPAKTLRDLLAIRDPLYREIADLVVETDERPPRMVVLDILSACSSCRPVKAPRNALSSASCHTAQVVARRQRRQPQGRGHSNSADA
jgi:shikimate kinase